MSFKSRISGQKGLTLVEVMIAMVIGLMLLGGVIQIFVTNKVVARTQSASARVQENGRMALDVLTEEIRMAGFQGCTALDNVIPNSIVSPEGSVVFSADNAIAGHEYSGGTWLPALASAPASVVDGTDLLELRTASCSAFLTSNMSTDNANIQIGANSSCDFEAGDILIISDCSSTDVFKATNVSEGGSITTIAHANSTNTTNRLTKPYGDDATVSKYEVLKYYIRDNDYGVPALYEASGVDGDDVIELVEGVEDMQILYGEDTSNNGAIDEYREAGNVSDWASVVSVRLTVLLQSVEDEITSSKQTYSFNGESVVATDNKLRQEMGTTILMRNRIF